ncbi:MAG: glycerophosphodiester phosphodiesterase family protein [Cyclobacteriaceae bacterium]
MHNLKTYLSTCLVYFVVLSGWGQSPATSLSPAPKAAPAGAACTGTVSTVAVSTMAPSRAAEILHRLQSPSEDYVLVVSHRGDWRYAPENSLLAVQRCIELGVDIVEIDVRLTKDGHLVAMHDLTVDRTTTGSGNVSDLTLAEIREFRLKNACGVKGSHQQVPTLTEIMELAKGKIMVNLDKTEAETVREAYEVLVETGTVDHAIFKGNDPVEVMRKKYGSLLDSIIYMPKVWYDLPDIPKYIADYNQQLSPIAYEMIFDQESSPVFRAIPQMNEDNITVLAIALWDELCAGRTDEMMLLEGPDASWGWLVDHGANAIMTDRPEALLTYLREKGLHE